MTEKDNRETLLRKISRDAFIEIDRRGIEVVSKHVEIFKQNNIIANMPAGTKNMTDIMIIEWYLGQLIDLYNKKAWHCINSWLNCCEKFTQ